MITDKRNIGKKANKKPLAQTQWSLIWRAFKKHRLALFGLGILAVFYFAGVLFPAFFAPYLKFQRFENKYIPPQKIHFVDQNGNFHLRPFVYQWEQEMDPETWQMVNKEDKTKLYPIYFFVHGSKYKLWGLFPTDLHFFGVKGDGIISLGGTDNLGRDLFSRTIYALRISLVIGFAGIFISLFLGLLFGGISGLLGGVIDDIIQRIIEILMSIPRIPLWMAFAAAVPESWTPVQVYFAITVILSLVGWTGLARVVRSKFFTLREEDFVSAAISFNSPMIQIIFKHLIPNFISYVLVSLTLSIPGMILGETALSFLGIGLRPPIVSLGVLLQQAQNYQTVALYPWLFIPGIMVIIVVLAYNFVGDGLRDAADPYN